MILGDAGDLASLLSTLGTGGGVVVGLILIVQWVVKPLTSEMKSITAQNVEHERVRMESLKVIESTTRAQTELVGRLERVIYHAEREVGK